MKKPSLSIVLPLCIVAVLGIIGCNDEPGPLGIKLLPPRDSVIVAATATTATSDATYLERITGASTTLLTGISNGIEARMLLGFSGIASIPVTNGIDSATLGLTINYRFLDSTGTLAFEIRKMLASVNPATFRWDSSTVAGAYSDTVSARFVKSVSPLDSTITLPLDTMLIRNWISTNGGSVIFLPQGNIVAGFTNGVSLLGDFRPLLKVYYHDASATPATLSLRSAWGIYVADGPIVPPADRIAVQSGIAGRGILHFDSISVPQLSSVTEAILQIAIDTAQSLTNKFSIDKIDAYIVGDASPPFDSLALGLTLLPAYDNGQKVYQGNARFIVQQWLLHQVNRGIILRATGEQTTLDRFIIYDANSPAALKPKLTITYTLLP
jgi:hypothetical protein